MTITVLYDHKIVLGLTGSIACYKSIDLASKLTQAGSKVDSILTEAAQHFIDPLSLKSVTGRDAYVDMWGPDDHVRHIRLGESADLMVVAPATAHTIAKLAHGLADNLLTVLALAVRCPVMIAPAMDGAMYENAATQANIELLKSRSFIFIGPDRGRMASGLIGKGRLVEPDQMLGHIRLLMGSNGRLNGQNVTITAGPTHEFLDPIRFLGNRSSGKQGFALAQAALDAGARVTLISGPAKESVPVGAEHVPVTTALEMRDAVLATMRECDALIMAAAVADYRPAMVADQKIKKSLDDSENLTIHLVRNPDILATVKAQREDTGRPMITVGFAAETQNAVEYGRHKMIKKGLDIIAINDVSEEDAGFAVDTNRVVLLSADGMVEEMPVQSKTAVAERIIEVLAERLKQIQA